MAKRGSSVSRIFSADKMVRSKTLNLLGVQVFRAVAARTLYNRVPASIEDDLSEKCDELEREGLLVWPDFLPSHEFESILRECHNLLNGSSNFRSRNSGPNTDSRLPVKSIDADVIPVTNRLLTDRRLKLILAAAERRDIDDLASLAKIEHLTQGTGEEGLDPQTQLHSDIFFNSHKVWFYLTDVTAEHGPLCFVKRSHRITPRQLLHIYTHSWKIGDEDDRSRRVTPAEMAKNAFDETTLICRRNTLVIANTCGYHRRRQGKAGRQRLAIHLELRAKNPFQLAQTSTALIN